MSTPACWRKWFYWIGRLRCDDFSRPRGRLKSLLRVKSTGNDMPYELRQLSTKERQDVVLYRREHDIPLHAPPHPFRDVSQSHRRPLNYGGVQMRIPRWQVSNREGFFADFQHGY